MMTAQRFSYFLEEPVLVRGSVVAPLTRNQLWELPPAEAICCSHVSAVLGMLRAHTGDRYRLVALGATAPDATCFSKQPGGTGEIRFTTGLLSLICTLAARCALIMEEHKFLINWMPAFARDAVEKQPLGFPFAFGEFELSESKRQSANLTPVEIEYVEQSLASDLHLLRNTARIASAAMEFVVLHELGHFDAKHDDIKRKWRTQVDVAVQRVFEHQADIFAVRLMLALGMLRPVGDEGPLVPSDVKVRQGNNILAYLGSSLALTIITLLRAAEPAAGNQSSVELIRSVKGEHPLPTTRLIVADAQVQRELKEPEGHAAIWPGSGEMEAVTLRAMTMQTLFLALTTLNAEWRKSINTFVPGRPLPLNIRYWIEDSGDLKEADESLQPAAVARAMQLVRQAAGVTGAAEVSVT